MDETFSYAHRVIYDYDSTNGLPLTMFSAFYKNNFKKYITPTIRSTGKNTRLLTFI